MGANPWLSEESEAESEAGSGSGSAGPRRPRWAAGAEVVVDADDALPTFEADRGGLWVVGAHGGAGATVLAGLLDAGDAGAAWPVPGPGVGRVRAVVAARTSAHGIERARSAAIQWASGDLPGVDLVGVVWVADAPGRLPRPLRGPLSLAGGAFPLSASVPWVGAWRIAAVDAAAVPGRVRRALGQLPVDEEEPS